MGNIPMPTITRCLLASSVVLLLFFQNCGGGFNSLSSMEATSPKITYDSNPYATLNVASDEEIHCSETDLSEIPSPAQLSIIGTLPAFGTDEAVFDEWKEAAIQSISMGNAIAISWYDLSSDEESLALLRKKLEFIAQNNSNAIIMS